VSPSQRTSNANANTTGTTTILGPTANSKRGGRRPGKPKSLKRLGQSFRQMASGRRRPPPPSGPPQGGARMPPNGQKMGPGGESSQAENFTDEQPQGGRSNSLGRSFRNATRAGDENNMRGYVGQSFRVVGKGVGTVTRPIGKGARKVTRPIAKSRVGRGVTKRMRQIAPVDDCSNMKLLQYLVPIILIIGCSVGLVISSGNGSKLAPGGGLKSLNSNVEDPFLGSEVPRWENKGGNGLELTMVNALEDKWQVVFALAIADWDFGNPDALTLNTEQIDHDVDCESVDGKVKVCNGDYGATKWRGINIAVVNSKSGYMEASSAKMNEYYLSKGGDAVMQYTMCHEVGHSLGLPHS
jgi:hypothetical protein